jgi:hypothetical protein
MDEVEQFYPSFASPSLCFRIVAGAEYDTVNINTNPCP